MCLNLATSTCLICSVKKSVICTVEHSNPITKQPKCYMKVLAQGRMSNYFLIKWFCLKLDDLMTRYYQMNHY